MVSLSSCAACPLYKGAVVPGEGPVPATIMLVGEAPGETEERLGRPFVGQSGELLDKLLRLAGIDRSQCYVTNRLKHRPPQNRPPKVSELKACTVWLEQELTAVRPTTIITLGRIAGTYFYPNLKLGIDHGQPRTVGSYTLIPMYHPAAGLRDATVWSTLIHDFSQLPYRMGMEEVRATPEYMLATDNWAAQFALTGTIGFDLETTSPKRGRFFMVHEAEIVGYSVAWAEGQAVYVAQQPGFTRIALESPIIEKVCHNTKFEYIKLKQIGVDLVNYQDTKIAAWLLQYHNSSLKALARQVLGRDPVTYEAVTQGRDMSEIDPQEVKDYAAADADNTLMLWPHLKRELVKAELWDIYRNIELPLIPVLCDMESRGLNVDVAQTETTLVNLALATEDAHDEVYIFGLPGAYDVASSDQLAEGLEALGAPITVRTESKQQLKTDEATLTIIREWNPPLIDAILKYRSLRKLRSYATQYKDLRGPDGRLHPDFIQAGSEEDFMRKESDSGPVTGRLACRAPNLQNQPHHKEGYEEWVTQLRRCLIPTEGWLLVSADVAQEEPRITAFIANDSQMLSDFAAGVPIYAPIAAILYGRPIDKERDPQQWHYAKTYFLAMNYGSGWTKIREIDPSIPVAQAKRAAHEMALRYPGLHNHALKTKEMLAQTGEVRDWFGRRRLIPKVFHRNRMIREEGVREGINFLTQAPAASVMKLAMQRVHSVIANMQAKMLITVHDELVLECPPEELDKVKNSLYSMTEGLMPIQLPVEVKVGKSWGEMEVVWE